MEINSKCPICESTLIDRNKIYSTEQLLKLWKVDFSEKVTLDHKSQTEETRLFECPQCKLGIYLPTLYGTSDFYAELQTKTKYYEEDKWDFKEALKDTKGLDRILEIGCGPGNFLSQCKELGINSIGSEYNIEAAKVAKEKGIKILDESEMAGQEGTFDAVFSFHVLEHVEDPVSFIKLHTSMVKSGGKICISVPNQNGPIKFIDPCIMNMPPHHLTRWKLNTFKVIGKKLDLKILRVAYEPLLLSNHSYYSSYFVSSLFTSDNRFWVKTKNFISKMLVKFFNYQIYNKGKLYYPFLKGMAIYVVFEKK